VFNSQILEVASGLVFVYLVLSTVSSGVKELIAHFLDMRATTLESAIRNMLADPGGALTSRLLNHPVIASTVQPGDKPPYISSSNFALAMFDILAPPNPVQSRTLQDLKNGVANLPDTKVRTTILGLLESSQQNVDLARQNLENWYDDVMDRVSGVYKRRAQAYLAGIGLVLCIGVNADSLMIVKELWNDQALRTAVASEAENAHTSGVCNGKDVLSCIRKYSVPPIGWARDGVRQRPQEWGNWFWKFFGFLVSGVAVALGAPFWFDLLNKIGNVRLTGNPPPDSRQSVTS
jgi:hypothetical protein